MSNQEMPPSSDESETIDVGIERNPFGDMNVNEILIGKVDDLNNESGVDVTVTAVEEPPVCLFMPVCDDDPVVAAIKFSLVINPKSHPVMYCGIGGKISTIGSTTNCYCLGPRKWSLSFQFIFTTSVWVRNIQCYYQTCHLQLHK